MAPLPRKQLERGSGSRQHPLHEFERLLVHQAPQGSALFVRFQTYDVGQEFIIPRQGRFF
ncbi:MAG: hypothetical protein U1D30_20825 [Planctomycetota bacterium]